MTRFSPIKSGACPQKTKVPVFVDSPLGLKITKVYSNLEAFWDKEAKALKARATIPLILKIFMPWRDTGIIKSCWISKALPSSSKRQKGRNLQGLIANDHVWTDEDIKAVESGRNIINHLSGNQVQRMQNKRILGTVGRTLLIAKRS